MKPGDLVLLDRSPALFLEKVEKKPKMSYVPVYTFLGANGVVSLRGDYLVEHRITTLEGERIYLGSKGVCSECAYSDGYERDLENGTWECWRCGASGVLE